MGDRSSFFAAKNRLQQKLQTAIKRDCNGAKPGTNGYE